MTYKEFKIKEDAYLPRTPEQFPMDDPFQRLVKVETVQQTGKKLLVFDETYPYVDHSWSYKWERFKAFFVLFFAVASINRFKYGLKIEGKKNLKGYKKLLKDGAVAICNHVYTYDAAAVYRALRHFKKFWIPMYAQHFNGPKGWYMRYMGGIPVPETMGGMRKFNEAFDEYHRRKDWIFVFPEEVRWDFYQPIRPFRKGAFTMAYKYGIPLIPCVFTYRPRTGIYKLFGKQDEPLVTLHIGTPILPDTTLPRKDEVDRLRIESHNMMEEMAGISLNPWPAIAEEE